MSDHIPGEDVGLEDGEGEPEKQRLHRRDTPHHLKNKRINQQQVRKSVEIQVNLVQRHFFLHQHNMTKKCSLIYQFST